MGLFDSIGNLGGLGSITKMLDLGNVVKDVVDKVLPQNMHFVGDIAGAVVDYETGNAIGAAKLGMEALKDLPQAAKGTQPPPQRATASGQAALASGPTKAELEPSPPPLGRDLKSFNWNDLLSAVKAMTAALSGQAATRTASAGAKAADASATKAAGSSTAAATDKAPASAPAGASNTSATTNPQAATPTAEKSAAAQTRTYLRTGDNVIQELRSPQGGWKRPDDIKAALNAPRSRWAGQPMTPAPAVPNHAATGATTAAAITASPASAPTTAASTASPASTSTAAPASAGAAPTSAAASAPSTSASGHPAGTSGSTTGASAAKPASGASTAAAASSGKAQTISSASQLKEMSDAAFMDAVGNGRISPDVAKDPAAMMAIQQRMNDITQMNNLMTAMMRAIHDMQMAVIQNIRI